MPFRIDPAQFPNRTKVQFTTSLSMPNLIYRACLATGTVSNTVYIQHAVAEALARDLNIPLEQVLADLPEPRSASKHLWHDVSKNQTGGAVRIGPANTIEEVR